MLKIHHLQIGLQDQYHNYYSKVYKKNTIIKNMSHVEEEVNEYILTEKDKEKIKEQEMLEKEEEKIIKDLFTQEKIIIIDEIKEQDKSNKKKSKKGKKGKQKI